VKGFYQLLFSLALRTVELSFIDTMVFFGKTGMVTW